MNEQQKLIADIAARIMVAKVEAGLVGNTYDKAHAAQATGYAEFIVKEASK